MNVIELAKSRNQQEGYNKQCISYYYKYCIKLHIYHNQHRLYLIPYQSSTKSIQVSTRIELRVFIADLSWSLFDFDKTLLFTFMLNIELEIPSTILRKKMIKKSLRYWLVSVHFVSTWYLPCDCPNLEPSSGEGRFPESVKITIIHPHIFQDVEVRHHLWWWTRQSSVRCVRTCWKVTGSHPTSHADRILCWHNFWSLGLVPKDNRYSNQCFILIWSK